jgi:hypothetical protein
MPLAPLVMLLGLRVSPAAAQAAPPAPSWLPHIELPHVDIGALRLREGADSLAHNLGDTWHKMSESVGDAVSNPVQSMVDGLFVVLRNFVRPLSNIVYVGVMLYGFYRLPANFMLVAGVLTMFVGPLVVGWVMRLLAAGLSTAAYAPFIIVFTAWLIVFLKSAVRRPRAPALPARSPKCNA